MQFLNIRSGPGIPGATAQYYPSKLNRRRDLNVRMLFWPLPLQKPTNPAVLVSSAGETRLQTSSSLVHSAVVSESAAADSSEALAFSVLQYLLGAGPLIKRGSCPSNRLVQGIAKATADPFDVSRYEMHPHVSHPSSLCGTVNTDRYVYIFFNRSVRSMPVTLTLVCLEFTQFPKLLQLVM